MHIPVTSTGLGGILNKDTKERVRPQGESDICVTVRCKGTKPENTVIRTDRPRPRHMNTRRL